MKNIQSMFTFADEDCFEIDFNSMIGDGTLPLRLIAKDRISGDIWIWLSKKKLQDLASMIELALQADDDQQREAIGRLRDGDKDAKFGPDGEVPF
jgi:hypothetical protein